MRIPSSAKYLVRYQHRAISCGTKRDNAHKLAEHLNIRYGGGYTVWNRYTKAVSKP